MATTAEYPQLSLSRVAPYIAVVLVTFVALVQCIVSFMPELESYGTPVLTWGGTFLLLYVGAIELSCCAGAAECWAELGWAPCCTLA